MPTGSGDDYRGHGMISKQMRPCLSNGSQPDGSPKIVLHMRAADALRNITPRIQCAPFHTTKAEVLLHVLFYSAKAQSRVVNNNSSADCRQLPHLGKGYTRPRASDKQLIIFSTQSHLSRCSADCKHTAVICLRWPMSRCGVTGVVHAPYSSCGKNSNGSTNECANCKACCITSSRQDSGTITRQKSV